MQTWRYMIKRILTGCGQSVCDHNDYILFDESDAGRSVYVRKSIRREQSNLNCEIWAGSAGLCTVRKISGKSVFMETWVPVMFFRKEEQ